MMEYQTRYNYEPVHFQTEGDSLTKQNHKNECDVNLILKKYDPAQLNADNRLSAQYGDFTNFDFRHAQNLIAQANTMFETLPAEIRAKFKNDPATFVDFVENPDNDEQSYKLGLKTRPEPVITEPEPSTPVDTTT